MCTDCGRATRWRVRRGRRPAWREYCNRCDRRRRRERNARDLRNRELVRNSKMGPLRGLRERVSARSDGVRPSTGNGQALRASQRRATRDEGGRRRVEQVRVGLRQLPPGSHGESANRAPVIPCLRSIRRSCRGSAGGVESRVVGTRKETPGRCCKHRRGRGPQPTEEDELWARTA
jgi:hypothetical protein